MWDLWKAGDRKGAAAAIPSHLIDELFISGSPGACKEQIQRYVECGLDTPVLSITATNQDMRAVTKALAPVAQ